MTNTYAIKLHSSVDIITNSSSELFVCKFGEATKELNKFAIEILESLGDTYSGNSSVKKITPSNIVEMIYSNSYYLKDYIPNELKTRIGFKTEDEYTGEYYKEYMEKLVKDYGRELQDALEDVYIIDFDHSVIGIKDVFEYYFGVNKS